MDACSQSKRIAALRRYAILDTPREPDFDDIVRLAAHICQTPIASVGFVDADRQWIKAEVGLGLDEVALEASICSHAIRQSGLFVVPDAAEDPRFAGTPLVVHPPHLRFYAGAVLETPDGHALGTLCVADVRPRTLTGEQEHALSTLARQVVTVLECRRALSRQAEVIARQEEIERDLRESDERLGFALEAAQAGVWYHDLTTGRTQWSKGNYRLFGVDPNGPAPSHAAWLEMLHPEDRVFVHAVTREFLGSRRDDQNFEFRVIHPELGIRWLASRGRVIYDEDGRPVRVLGLNQDITERKLAEKALRASEERLRRGEAHLAQAQAIAQLGSWELELPSNRVTWSAEMHRIFGIQNPRPTLEDVLGHIHPEDRDRVVGFLGEAPAGARKEIEARIVQPDGELRFVRSQCETVRSDTGEAIRIVGTLQDITEQHRRVERRRELEQQLHQAQKMEAVGQLTGGMAHDFNNLLSVVIGNLDLAEFDAALSDDTRELIVTARDAGLRGAELTARLLAFARRQPLQPRPIDLNAAIAEHMRLLQRLLGPNIEIRLETAAGLWPVELDPVQFETALTNLATNARDAMPQGGRLTIRTANVDAKGDAAGPAGEGANGCVEIEISDTGMGMPPELLARAFEPFFTTKEVGKGTGLGLSMVYGFIKQSGGHVEIRSEPGQGTVVRLYLPSTGSPWIAEDRTRSDGNDAPVAGHRERILVVDDDPHLRPLLVRQLHSLGYDVREATGGREALALLERGESIDLLLTDIVMPGLSGDELARQARGRWPGLKVLFISGFPETALDDRGLLDGQALFLPKPYRKRELAEKVQAALGR